MALLHYGDSWVRCQVEVGTGGGPVLSLPAVLRPDKTAKALSLSFRVYAETKSAIALSIYATGRQLGQNR